MSVPTAASQELAKLAQRSMQLQCTIQDGHVWFADDAASIAIEPLARKAAE